MLLMVTNRRVIDGKFADEEKRKHRYEYLYAHNNQGYGNDGFETTSKKGFEIALLQELDRLKKSHNVCPKVGIYIHGYNKDYQESINEIYDLEKYLQPFLGYPPVIVGFSWPSNGNVLHYLSDREEARDSVGAFTRFLLDINSLVTDCEQHCFSTTFCIAHSMGNYLLRKGMEYMSDKLGTPKGRLLFDETIMLAPDLSARDIEKGGKADYISDFSRRVHVYYSKHDVELKASSAKRFSSPRLGRHGASHYENLPDNVVVVDAKKYANNDAINGYTSRVGGQVSVHSSYRYHQAILEDIIYVLSSIDRDQIPNRQAYQRDGEPMSNHYLLT